MDISAVVPCVDYDDFLALTLPRNLGLLPSLCVLTSPIDRATIALATRLGVPVFTTDAWHLGGPLNKAYALNEWLDHIPPPSPDQWLMILDADILLPASFPEDLAPLSHTLDPRSLYSIRRRMCHDSTSLHAYLEGRSPLDEFPADTSLLENGRVWDRPVSNIAALAGYLQLWSPCDALGARRFPVTGSAEAYDVYFALSFPEEHRNFLDPLEVLHLGPTRVNWHGRRSPRWS